MQPFAHKQLLSALYIVPAIKPNTLTAGNTINTYSASPQPAAGIDSWDNGRILPRKLLLVVDVASATAGTLTITLRDDGAAITTANGDANTNLVATLANITAAGLYVAEINLDHIFPFSTIDVSDYIERYHSVRAVATGGNYVFNVLAIYGLCDRNYPVSEATALAITYNDPTS